MNQKKFLAVSVALSMSLLSQHTLAADSTTLVSASSTLSNLSYKVVDLNKWDLYWPSLKTGTATQVRGSLEVASDTLSNGPFVKVSKDLQGTPFASTKGSVTLPNGQASAVIDGAKQLKTSVNVSAADINGILSHMGANGSTSPYFISASGHMLGQSASDPYNAGFTLSARSSLVIQGTYSVETNLNANLIDPAAVAAFKATHPDGFTLLTQSWVSGTFRLTGDGSFIDGISVSYSDGFLGSTDSAEAYQVSQRGAFKSGGKDNLNKTFTITLTNPTNKAISGFLDYQAQSLVSVMPTFVPEPGTWALMGLGLMGVAVASRRARQG